MTGARTSTRGASRVMRAGRFAWSVVGLFLLAAIVLGLLATVSELVLPLAFALVLGAACYPLARWLHRWLPHGGAAALVVTAAALLVAGLVLIVVNAVVGELGELSQSTDQALDELADVVDGVGIGPGALDEVRGQFGDVAGVIGRGLLSALVGGLDATIGFIGGSVLAMLLMYYVLKDGPAIRDRTIAQLPQHLRDEGRDFASAAVRTIRGYWAGRAVLSAVVALFVAAVSIAMGLPLVATIAVVNFLGGFVPYIGAVLGGGLAALLALAEHGIPGALVIVGLVIAANVLLENLLEPRVMSGRLSIHPLVVLVATTAGGVVGGIVGLVLALPATAIALDLARRVRRTARATADISESS